MAIGVNFSNNPAHMSDDDVPLLSPRNSMGNASSYEYEDPDDPMAHIQRVSSCPLLFGSQTNRRGASSSRMMMTTVSLDSAPI
jgi:hypothetical protein